MSESSFSVHDLVLVPCQVCTEKAAYYRPLNPNVDQSQTILAKAHPPVNGDGVYFVQCVVVDVINETTIRVDGDGSQGNSGSLEISTEGVKPVGFDPIVEGDSTQTESINSVGGDDQGQSLESETSEGA